MAVCLEPAMANLFIPIIVMIYVYLSAESEEMIVIKKRTGELICSWSIVCVLFPVPVLGVLVIVDLVPDEDLCSEKKMV